jgi:hypothetical protein
MILGYVVVIQLGKSPPDIGDLLRFSASVAGE